MLRRAAALVARPLSSRPLLAAPLARPLPLLSSVLSRHAYPAPKAEDSPPGLGERLAVLFPRGKRKTVTMEVKKRVLKVRRLAAPAHRPPVRPRADAHLSGVWCACQSNPHMGSKRLKRMVRKHARRGNFNSFIAEYESRLDRFLWRVNVAASPFASRVIITRGHVMVNGADRLRSKSGRAPEQELPSGPGRRATSLPPNARALSQPPRAFRQTPAVLPPVRPLRLTLAACLPQAR